MNQPHIPSREQAMAFQGMIKSQEEGAQIACDTPEEVLVVPEEQPVSLSDVEKIIHDYIKRMKDAVANLEGAANSQDPVLIEACYDIACAASKTIVISAMSIDTNGHMLATTFQASNLGLLSIMTAPVTEDAQVMANTVAFKTNKEAALYLSKMWHNVATLSHKNAKLPKEENGKVENN